MRRALAVLMILVGVGCFAAECQHSNPTRPGWQGSSPSAWAEAGTGSFMIDEGDE